MLPPLVLPALLLLLLLLVCSSFAGSGLVGALESTLMKALVGNSTASTLPSVPGHHSSLTHSAMQRQGLHTML